MGLFSRFFSKKAEPLQDYAWLGVDMHSHLIPGIDDGAKSMEDSMQLARGLSDLGFTHAITTPHIMTDFYRNTPDQIFAGLAQVQQAMEAEGIPLKLAAAAEYYLDEGLEPKMNEGPLLTFGQNHVLFEVSYINRPQSMERLIFKLNSNGYKPILAHPERYTFLYDDYTKYAELKAIGVLFQLNILSLLGHYGPHAKMIGNRLIDDDMIDLLGSDVHSMRHLGGLRAALAEPGLQKLAENPDRLLNKTLVFA